MERLEKALIDSREPLTEFGLSPEAAASSRIYSVGVPKTKIPGLSKQIANSLSRNADQALLARLRRKARKIAEAEPGS